MKTISLHRSFIASVAVLAGLISGCETVANVAQNVSDSARPSKKAVEPDSTTLTSPNSQVGATPRQPSNANAPACEKNFAVSGSFFSGKQFTTNAPLPRIAPDAAYRKAFAEVAKRGWQIISSDKDVRMISASQNVSMSSGGKTVPLNILISDEKGKGTTISFTFSISGGLATSEDGVLKTFCDFTKSVAS